MPMIYVRSKPGVVARVTPGGKVIPDDSYIPVHDTPRIRRMIDVHGDVQEQPAPKAPAKPTKPE
jgi:hypothetical protein